MTHDVTQMLTVRQAAELVNCHMTTIRNGIKSTKLKHLRAGRTIRIVLTDLMAWLQANAAAGRKYGRKWTKKLPDGLAVNEDKKTQPRSKLEA